ncbi:hypothetical protein [Pseudoalteromonas marina]|uniref:Uncharacterized protein n=1 Tax=Pseudoalteromonas marina TaxID=267375 RepID=A0ABT9FHY6_9GAMM|nr:hypothetical protein [Pseudoalteromonas marina]MDP2566410.1 hypothetical protein [Pseudoalteromonas marina]
MNNVIRIPSITASIFDQEKVVSLTASYLQSKMDVLESVRDLYCEIDEAIEEGENIQNILSKRKDDFDEPEKLELFDDNNLIDFIQNKELDNLTDIIDTLRGEWPILDVVDVSEAIFYDNIEQKSELSWGEVFPLYCEPKEETIKHFIDLCSCVAFMEVEGNYFIYLTTSGQDFSRELAYAYLCVDDCIPSNILTDQENFSPAGEYIATKLTEFFNS